MIHSVQDGLYHTVHYMCEDRALTFLDGKRLISEKGT